MTEPHLDLDTGGAEAPMMGCGHAANATTADGRPVCAIDVGLDPAAEIVVTAPDLTGRTARCSCGSTAPSSTELGFFEYRGPGSVAGARACANCGYFLVAHEWKKEGAPHVRKFVCDEFVSRGEYDFDLYYCGHAGWD